MAVDAQRLFAAGHHQPSSALGGLVGRPGAAMPMSGTAAAAFSPCYGGAAVGSQQQQQQQHHGYLPSSSYMGLVPPPPQQASAGGQQDYQYSQFLPLAAVDLAKRGVRLDGSSQQTIAAGGYKRKREDQSSPVPGAASVLAAHAQQQAVAVDSILIKHAANMWTALAEQRKKQMGLIVSTVEARAAKRLKAKDEEIERARGMNWALEDRIRNLYVEAQMWRDMAHSNEAAANALRADLQRALDAQQAAAVRPGGGDAEDAGSCCWGENENHVADNCGGDEGEEEEVRTPAAAAAPGVGRCKGCGEGGAVVLLLPCRHLCVCASCGDTARACPACGCAKNGTVCVNFS